MKSPTTKQVIERWENVIRVLRALTPHERRRHFDMSVVLEKSPCGTVGCAVGFCMLDPWFQRRGLKARWDDSISGYVYPKYSKIDDFFGEAGTSSIFWDGTPRSVGTVIREVREHIKWLRDYESWGTEK